MSALSILILTVLAALAIVALALLAGSLALLTAPRSSMPQHGSGFGAALAMLDKRWQLERTLYRHHRLFGAVVVATALYFGWQLQQYGLPGRAADTPWAATIWILAAGQALNLAAGLVIFLRPSLLKPIESRVNHWHSLDDPGTRPGLPRRLKAALISVLAMLVLLACLLLIGEGLASIRV